MHRIAVATASVILIGIIVSCNHGMIMMLSAAYAITYYEHGLPAPLSGDEFVIVRNTALSDPRVQELIGGRNYVISSCCAFVHGGGSPSAPWQPVINLSVANKLQIGVSVGIEARNVTSIYTMPYIQFQVPKSDTTAAEKVAERSPNNDGSRTSMPFLATNTTTVIPLILALGIGIGGAAAGVFYYSLRKKEDNHLATEEKTK